MNNKSKRLILPYSTGLVILMGVLITLMPNTGSANGHPNAWNYAWPDTDFSKHDVPYSDILSGGPSKDGIPPIDQPQFITVKEAQNNAQAFGSTGLSDTEPVVGLEVNGESKAYPLRILTWHEIVNDEIGGVPVTVTFCPLCNSSIVFDRRYKGQILDFGTTGNLRNSDLVMYDRQTESWWQQFLGQAIIGEMTGATLKFIPSRLESWGNFRKRAPDAKVLIPNNVSMRNYGRNPYVGYDSASFPFLYRGEMPENINPMVRVVAIDKQAWTLELLRKKERITSGDIIISWSPGQNSVLDSGTISQGRDVGNVLVQRIDENNTLVDVVHDITFAFVFHAFRPDGVIHQ